MRDEPCHTMLGHIVLRILHVSENELVLVLKIIEQLGMTHSRLGGDIAEGHPVNGLFLYAALESHQNLRAHFFFVNNYRHNIILSQIYRLVNKTLDGKKNM